MTSPLTSVNGGIVTVCTLTTKYKSLIVCVTKPTIALAENDAEHEAEQRPDQPQHGCFCQNQRRQLAAGDAQTAQNAEHRPTLHDAKRDCVVNQKHADDERQQAHRGQVEFKGGGHLLDGVAACRCRFNIGVGGQNGVDLRQNGVVFDNQVNMAQCADLVEHLLRGADVHENQIAQPTLRQGSRPLRSGPRCVLVMG